MGQEANCAMVRGKTRHAGRALLEGDHLVFRGEAERLTLRFADLTNVTSDNGRLTLATRQQTVTLELGAAADRWAHKIRNPRSLLDKLGVKDGMRVGVIGIDDASFLQQLHARCPDAVDGRAPRNADLIFLGAETLRALERLGRLRASLTPNGAIWVVHRKGKAATLKDVDVFAAAKAAGLVDNKVAAFSETHTAERLVIPVRDRPRT